MIWDSILDLIRKALHIDIRHIPNYGKFIVRPTRRTIYTDVDGCPYAALADTVYKRVIEHDPRVSLGTVYRNLEFLSESGQILRIKLPQGPDHFDFNTKPHIHFYCTECMNISDMPDESVTTDEAESLPRAAGYNVKERFLLYLGTCPECNKNKH